MAFRSAALLVAILFLVTAANAIAADRPNILWLSCEDISPHLGCYGDPHAITPNLDQLASEGVRYTHVFTAAGVCAPCRSTIITGMYQNSIGTHHMRCKAQLPEWLLPFPAYLREAGYYCTNNRKTDYQFQDPAPSTFWDESSAKAHWRNKSQEQPFFAVFNFTGCHESGIAGTEKYETVTADLPDAHRQDPTALTTLPPYYPDTPVTREDWKRNYELITAMDAWVGQHLNDLAQAGLAEDTIVVFWSDHGVGLPRAKRWLYDSGTRIPFIVRIPARFRSGSQGVPGTVNDELVNSTDFAPTMLRLAGLSVPDYMQGRAFLGDGLTPPRQYVYGARDRMDERYDIIRSVRDQRFRYIRNFEPLKPYYQYMNTPEKGATMREIRIAEQQGTLSAIARQFSSDFKPVEELYDLREDPHEVNNLAERPEHAERLQQMRDACLAWQTSIRDLGLVPEAEIEVREQQVGARYHILHNSDSERVMRLVRIASRASEGTDALADLSDALGDEDAAVRYWGATGIGNIGTDARSAARDDLVGLLEDPSPSVRIAAARGLCRMGDLSSGLPLLVNELKGPQEWARLSAAIVLDELDEDARPVLADLQQALSDQPNKYIVRVANRAVNDLLGTSNIVP